MNTHYLEVPLMLRYLQIVQRFPEIDRSFRSLGVIRAELALRESHMDAALPVPRGGLKLRRDSSRVKAQGGDPLGLYSGRCPKCPSP